MKFAVTGGAGFIGNYLVKKLISENHQVIVIDNFHTGKEENLKQIIKCIEIQKTDIRDFDQLKKTLKKVDGVFHKAALTTVPESFIKPEEYNDVNVVGTDNVFKIAKEYNLKVVYASSSSVYGNTEKIPIKEDFPRNPINPYGKTKLDDEYLAEKYSSENLDVIGLRYFNVYGIGQTGSYAGVITQFLNRLKENKPPIINGEGNQIRDFVYVKDVAQANLVAMKSNVKKGFFNIGSGKTISIKKLAEIMIDLSGLDLEPIFGKKLEGDIEKSQADTYLTSKMLGWKSETILKDGLKALYKD
jgi:UDP-glucose 4-epimerase